MNNNSPLVTIVIPSYNQGKYIRHTLDSILNQDYSNIEVIVMDGGSTDQTLEILSDYRGRIEYFSEPDRGQSDAINKGFRLAKGDIVTWLNSDDIYPDRAMISRMVGVFALNKGYDLIYGNFIEIDANNRILRAYRRPSYSSSRLLRIGYISQPATFFRRRVIESMAVRESLCYAMDLEYWLRADRLGFAISHVNFLVAAERIHDDAKCVRDNPSMAVEARMVRESYGAVFDAGYKIQLFFDRLLLYILRLLGIFDLLFYKKNRGRLTVPLRFCGAIRGTLAVRSLKKIIAP